MENISRFIADDKYKKILKETSGLGTPATRADILEKLKKLYLTSEKNKLMPNEKAILLIDVLKDSKIIDPLYTAEMEQSLEDDPDKFMESAIEYTKEFVSWAKKAAITPLSSGSSKHIVLGQCPECGGEVVGYEKLFSCKNNKKENSSCRFRFWRNGLEKLGKKSITDAEAAKLLAKQPLKMNFQSSKGKKYQAGAHLYKDESGVHRIKVEFNK